MNQIDESLESLYADLFDSCNMETEINSSEITDEMVPSTIEGFNVKMFEELAISKKIASSKKISTYVKKYLSISELQKCPKQIYFSWKKVETNPNQFHYPYLDLICEVGNTVHKCIQKTYDFNEVEKTIIAEEYHVKGRVDAIKDSSLIEIKSIDESKYNGPQRDHYIQANIGAFILNNFYSYKLNNITLIYVFRSLKKIDTFNFLYNESSVKLYLDKAKKIYQDIIDNKEPVVEKDSNLCIFCEYKHLC